MKRPEAFSDESFRDASARAAAERRWLLVSVVDSAKAVSWAALYTIWREPEIVTWLEAHAIAIQVDVRADPALLNVLDIEPDAAPMVTLWRDGKERLRVLGHKTVQELISLLERAEAAEQNVVLARTMVKHPERDLFHRSHLAQALLRAGLCDEALEHYDWVWCHAGEPGHEMAGVRVTFMATSLSELCGKYPAAQARFSELRDLAGGRASTTSEAGLRACIDFVVLNEVLDEDDRTMIWFAELDASQRSRLPDWLVDHLLPLLYERACWKDAGALVRRPIDHLEQALDRARRHAPHTPEDTCRYQRHLIAEGRPREAKRIARTLRSVYHDVGALHRSLLAAGRVSEATEVREAALRFEDSRSMRAALADLGV